MSEKIRTRIYSAAAKIKFMPKCYVIIPLLIIVSAIIIRLATGGTHVIYSALGGRGFFPGPFLYWIFYLLRLTLCSIILTFMLFTPHIYNERLRCVLFSIAVVILLLFEYRLIFGGVSLILAIAFAVFAAVLCFFSVAMARFKNRYISISLIVFIVLQAIHFAELISLLTCI